ncbi:MAG TPA: DNA repair photolyase, partial [Eubacteriaceae bacterium]|nr:DNA repair photolyase [Eubacteriaceae bacterium]
MYKRKKKGNEILRSSKANLFHKFFSHVYIERDILHHDRTQEILRRFPRSKQIVIEHYKDVFNRKKQNYRLQKMSPKLILAERKEHFFYPGSFLCQDFGNTHFYYTTLAMGCIFDCEYCYLQGMHPSGNIVFFVNLEDYFHEIERILKKHPLFLSVSYDTDLLTFERYLQYGKGWIEFANEHPNLTLELRTKSNLVPSSVKPG